METNKFIKRMSIIPLFKHVPCILQGNDLLCGYCTILMLFLGLCHENKKEIKFMNIFNLLLNSKITNWAKGISPNKLNKLLNNLFKRLSLNQKLIMKEVDNDNNASDVWNFILDAVHNKQAVIIWLPKSIYYKYGHYLSVKGFIGSSLIIVNDSLIGERLLSEDEFNILPLKKVHFKQRAWAIEIKTI